MIETEPADWTRILVGRTHAVPAVGAKAVALILRPIMRKEEFTARLPSRTIFDGWSDGEKRQHLADLIGAFLDLVEAGNAPLGDWEINGLGTAMAALRSGFHSAALAEVIDLIAPEHERSTDPRYKIAARAVTLPELRQELAATRQWRSR